MTSNTSIPSEGGGVLYHATPNKFKEFDLNRMEGGVAWFTDNAKEIDNNTVGAVQGAGQKLNIMKRTAAKEMKWATPELQDKYYTDQLIQMGYDGVKMESPNGKGNWYKVFDPNKTLKEPSSIPSEPAKKFDTGRIDAIVRQLKQAGLDIEEKDLFKTGSNAFGKDIAINDNLFNAQIHTPKGSFEYTSSMGLRPIKGNKWDDIVDYYQKNKYTGSEKLIKPSSIPSEVGEVLYRGEGGTNKFTGVSSWIKGKNFATDLERAKAFGNVSEYMLKPDARVLKIDTRGKSLDEIAKEIGVSKEDVMLPQRLNEILKKKGYDAIENTTRIVDDTGKISDKSKTVKDIIVLNEDVVLSKSSQSQPSGYKILQDKVLKRKDTN